MKRRLAGLLAVVMTLVNLSPTLAGVGFDPFISAGSDRDPVSSILEAQVIVGRIINGKHFATYGTTSPAVNCQVPVGTYTDGMFLEVRVRANATNFYNCRARETGATDWLPTSPDGWSVWYNDSLTSTEAGPLNLNFDVEIQAGREHKWVKIPFKVTTSSKNVTERQGIYLQATYFTLSSPKPDDASLWHCVRQQQHNADSGQGAGQEDPGLTPYFDTTEPAASDQTSEAAPSPNAPITATVDTGVPANQRGMGQEQGQKPAVTKPEDSIPPPTTPKVDSAYEVEGKQELNPKTHKRSLTLHSDTVDQVTVVASLGGVKKATFAIDFAKGTYTEIGTGKSLLVDGPRTWILTYRSLQWTFVVSYMASNGQKVTNVYDGTHWLNDPGTKE